MKYVCNRFNSSQFLFFFQVEQRRVATMQDLTFVEKRDADGLIRRWRAASRSCSIKDWVFEWQLESIDPVLAITNPEIMLIEVFLYYQVPPNIMKVYRNALEIFLLPSLYSSRSTLLSWASRSHPSAFQVAKNGGQGYVTRRLANTMLHCTPIVPSSSTCCVMLRCYFDMCTIANVGSSYILTWPAKPFINSFIFNSLHCQFYQ